MSFSLMHNDYLDPDIHLWPEEPPCEFCKHDTGNGCDIEECTFEGKEECKNNE